MTATTSSAPTTDRTMPLVLPRLTSTRAVAACVVFVAHLITYLIVSASSIGPIYSLLAYFFILSGFVLTWSTSARTTTSTFYRRRFARVWPNHLATMLVAFLVPVTNHAPNLLAFLVDALLLQAWVPKGDVLFGFNGVSWSLSVEVSFYAAMPFLLPWLRRLTTRRRWQAAIGVFLLDSVLVLLAAHIGGHAATGGYTFPPLRAGEFLLGCVAAIEMREGWRLSRRAVYAMVVGGIVVGQLLPHPLPSLNVFYTPVYFALIVHWVAADIDGRGGPWTWRWLVYAGQLSFAFYLVHELVIINFVHWFDLPAVPLTALMFATAALGAAALHHGVEQPAQRWLSRRGPRKAADSDKV